MTDGEIVFKKHKVLVTFAIILTSLAVIAGIFALIFSISFRQELIKQAESLGEGIALAFAAILLISFAIGFGAGSLACLLFPFIASIVMLTKPLYKWQKVLFTVTLVVCSICIANIIACSLLIFI